MKCNICAMYSATDPKAGYCYHKEGHVGAEETCSEAKESLRSEPLAPPVAGSVVLTPVPPNTEQENLQPKEEVS